MRLSARKPKNPDCPNELKTLGDHLRTKRLALGLLQKDVAQQLDVDVDSICRWEVGYRHPKNYLMPRIIDFLGYAPYWPAPTLGAWLMVARRANGLSRKRLAKSLGVDESTVFQWETDRKQPAPHLVARLKTILAAGDQ